MFQGLGTGDLLSLTRLDSHQLYIWHRTGAHLLETTTSSIPDISEESGFSSSRAFIEIRIDSHIYRFAFDRRANILLPDRMLI